VRLNLGIDANQNVAMKLTVRSSDPAVSDLIHQIIANA
jgi:coatomer protein complex subunit gamma